MRIIFWELGENQNTYPKEIQYIMIASMLLKQAVVLVSNISRSTDDHL